MKRDERKSVYDHWRKIELSRCTETERLRIVQATARKHPGLVDLLFLEGAVRLMSVWAAEFPDPVRVEQRQRVAQGRIQRRVVERQLFQKFDAEARVAEEKAKSFDRIVEMLDLKMVGNKLLGDCTKADLIRAAVDAESKAGELTLEAGFYRLLANLVGPKGTVREASDRGKIVALLTHTFQDKG